MTINAENQPPHCSYNVISPYYLNIMRVAAERSMRSSGASDFRLDCFPFIFSIEELEVLEKKGQKMKALAEGRITPASREEKSFVQFCRGETSVISIMETAWIKYLNRRKRTAWGDVEES